MKKNKLPDTDKRRLSGKVKPHDRPELFDMREKGHTYQDIGTYFGVTRERIRQILLQDRPELCKVETHIQIKSKIAREKLRLEVMEKQQEKLAKKTLLKEVVDKYKNGALQKELREEYGMSQAKISYAVIKAGESKYASPIKYSAEENRFLARKIKHLLQKGKTQREIAEVLDVRLSHVYWIVQAYINGPDVLVGKEKIIARTKKLLAEGKTYQQIWRILKGKYSESYLNRLVNISNGKYAL